MVRAEVRSSSAGYGGDLQLQAQGWIEDVTGEPFQGDFADGLRDGTRLCKLLNAIKPSSIRRVNPYKEGQKFKQMENISNFIRGCRALGVPEYSLFETVDLYEGKDVGLVVKCLHALGGTVQLKCPEFEGPHLGLKPVSRTSPQKRAPGAAPAKTWPATSSSSSSSGPAKSWAAPSAAKPPVSTSAASSSPPYGSRANANGAGDGAGGPASSSATSSSSSFSPSPSSSSSLASSLTPTEALPPPPSFDPAAPKIVGRAPQEKGAPSPPPYNGTAQRWGPGEVQDAAPSAAGGSKDALPPPPAYRSDLSTKFDESVSVAETRNGPTSPHGDLGRPANGSPPAARNGHMASNGAAKKQPQEAVEATHGGGNGSSGGGDRWSSPPRAASAVSSGGAPAAVAATPAATAHAPGLSVVGASATTSPDRSPTGRGGGYGLDAELAARREANYDYDAEAEAREWIEDVTREAFVSGFAEELKDGSRLCRLINCIKPGTVRRVNNSKMPFKQMENVSNFLKACRAVGVAEHSLFETVDLYEGKDIGLVVRCLHALGQTVQKSCPEYDGPRLGVRQTDANKREWTPEQQQQQQRHSSGAMSQLMAGSSKTMERGSVIKTGVTFGATQSGTGDPSAMSGWTMGSAKTMDRSHITKSGPTFGAEYAGASEDATGAASRFTAGHRC